MSSKETTKPTSPEPVAVTSEDGETIVISKTELAAMIDSIVSKRVEAIKEEQSAMPPGNWTLDMNALGAAIASGIAANAPRRKVTIGEYDPKTAYQQGTPLKQMPKMRRAYFQNGFLLDATRTIKSEIELLNQITHSGRYLERKVEVIVGDDGADETVEIRWPCKTGDMRSDMKGIARNFTEMLQMIVAEQAVERQEQEDLKAERDARRARAQATVAQERHFGDNANSRAAREKAAA